MKTYIIVIFMLLMASCHYSDNELTRTNGTVTLTVVNETFKVDFRFCVNCRKDMSNWDLSGPFAGMKTRDDLLNLYKTKHVPIQMGYSSFNTGSESVFAMLEYKLAQECFNDNCDSEFRKEVLQLATNFQKAKYQEYNTVFCAQKSGVFLMAVILAKEREHTIEFVDRATLQQALLCLSNDKFVSEDFSNLIIEYSEKFLTSNKN